MKFKKVLTILLAGASISTLSSCGVNSGVTADVNSVQDSTKCTITLKCVSNDGVVNSTAIEKIKNGASYFPTIVPEAEGYVFLGWYQDETCCFRLTGDIVINEDITLYAKFVKPTQEENDSNFENDALEDNNSNDNIANETQIT